MSTQLHNDHPAQLVWGFLLETEKQAIAKRQAMFSFLANCARPAVLSVRELFSEIASDATYGADLVVRVASDGKITADEVAELSNIFKEIEVEALEGRIV